ncbi:response regulator transcription factor [Synechococcus sp. KORDI-52]|uniref:response regulator transcription factor n=1 Tax=Synechococcus sp. KORDI-52 TaxID=585425 RepID=UPI0006897359|nr:helix-turn-helix transcriptional regulator [Synechococcus sp. KORDI-52]
MLLLQGLNNRAIAQRLVISHRTVECHISRALQKSGCCNRLELALWLIGEGDTALNCQASAVTMKHMPA